MEIQNFVFGVLTSSWNGEGPQYTLKKLIYPLVWIFISALYFTLMVRLQDTSDGKWKRQGGITPLGSLLVCLSASEQEKRKSPSYSEYWNFWTSELSFDSTRKLFVWYYRHIVSKSKIIVSIMIAILIYGNINLSHGTELSLHNVGANQNAPQWGPLQLQILKAT